MTKKPWRIREGRACNKKREKDKPGANTSIDQLKSMMAGLILQSTGKLL